MRADFEFVCENLEIISHCVVAKVEGKKYHLRVARAVSKKIQAEDAAAANLRDLTLYHFDLHGR